VAFPWGYGHIVLFGSIIATGAGLHVAALRLEDQSDLGSVATVLSVVVPVVVYVVSVFALYTVLRGSFDTFHGLLIGGTVVVLAAAVFLAGAGVPVPVCLVVAMVAPFVVVVGYETIGHRHAHEMLDHLPTA
jgi:low temperature requirement protein LtrA